MQLKLVSCLRNGIVYGVHSPSWILIKPVTLILIVFSSEIHRIEEFIKIVDKSLSRFHEHKLLIQKFKLHMTLVDLKWASVVDK